MQQKGRGKTPGQLLAELAARELLRALALWLWSLIKGDDF